MDPAKGVTTTERFVFFWAGWPSQWYKSGFRIGGIHYGCCEQFMMVEKARAFGDTETANAIMATQNPRKQKALGRQVRGFDPDIWNGLCRDIVYRGNLAKYQQNPLLQDWLLATGDRTIAEASPADLIWGIGLAVDHPDARSPDRWPGKNWLGIAIMKVRECIRTSDASDTSG